MAPVLSARPFALSTNTHNETRHQDYMREAWAVEPRHSTHQGVPLEDLLLTMAVGSGGSTIDLSDEEPYYASSPPSSPSWSPTPVASLSADQDPVAEAAAMQALRAASDMSGCGSAAGVRAADGFSGSHILPIYPGSAAAFAPVCTHVPTLQKGRREGYESVQRVLLPVLDSLPARRVRR